MIFNSARISMTELFTGSQNELAKLAKAFAHPGRIEDSRMCYCLSDEGIAAMITFLNQINEAAKLNIDNCS